MGRHREGPEWLPVPVHVEHRHVRANGCRFHVAEAGDGPPLLLLHGWPQHWWMWRAVMGDLAAHRRLICPDLRGLGWSEAPPRGYRRGDMARDVLGLLDALAVDRCDVVAHDWGLIPGYWLALHWSWRVRRLVALSGPHIWAVEGTPPLALLRLWHFVVLASPLGSVAVRRGMASRALRTWRHHGAFDPDERAIYLSRVTRPEAARATARRYRRLIFDFLWFAGNAPDLGLPVPTLNLVGEHDHLANASPPNRFFGSNAVDFRYEIVSDAGHFLVEEQPRIVAKRILDFLEEGDRDALRR